MASNFLKTPEAPKGAPASELHTKLVEKAEVLLKLAKAQYKIITADGKEFGELQVQAPKPERRTTVNRGITEYFLPYFDVLKKAGDVAVIPHGPYTLDSLQRAVAGRASQLFGRGGTYTTHIRDDHSALEVMLTQDPPSRGEKPAQAEPDPLAGMDLSGLTDEQIKQARDLLK